MDELERVIYLGKETKAVDYKGPIAWVESDKKACCELVKDILAMANHGGGYLVIGVEEVAAGFSHVGLTSEQLESYDTTRLNRFVQNYADPPINCTVVKKESNGKTFVVVEVPGFPDTPHICQKDFPQVLQSHCLYVRTDNNESAPIKSSASFRALIDLAIRKRQDMLLGAIKAVMSGATPNQPERESTDAYLRDLESVRARAKGFSALAVPEGKKPIVGYRETFAYPSRYEAERFDLKALHAAAQKANVDYQGWPFLFYGELLGSRPHAAEGGVEAQYALKNAWQHEMRECWHLGASGLFYQRTLLPEEIGFSETNPFVETKETIRYIAEAVQCVSTLYSDLFDLQEPITLAVTLGGVKGRRLLTLNGNLIGNYVSDLDRITYSNTRTLADWRAGVVDYSVQAAGYIFERFNWTNWNEGFVRQVVQDLFARRLR